MWRRLFPKYGNWGGPGWSGGAYPKYYEDTDWEVPGIDSMDELFKDHDQKYQLALKEYREGRLSHTQLGELWQFADVVLLRNLRLLWPNPRNWKRPAPCCLYAKVYRFLCRWAFTARVVVT